MSEYKISIICPVFNVEDYIEKSFNSLLNQTFGFSNLEVIYVDDCSSDNSPDIIDQYAQDYDNVFSYHLEENSGFAGKPRNVGIEKSTSEFLLFLDSDDYLEYDACEKLYSHIKDNPDLDFISGGYTNIYPNGDVLSQVPRGFKGIYANGKVVTKIPKGLPECSIITNPMDDYELFSLNALLAAKLIKKDFLLENNIYFEEGIPAQDIIFTYLLLLHSNNLALLNDYSAFNRVVRSESKNKSVSFNVSLKFLYNTLKAANKIADLCEDYKIKDDFAYLALSRMLEYFLVKFENPVLTNGEREEIISSEEYLNFKNRDFFKNKIEFQVIFENVFNFGNNPKYANHLRKKKMEELKLRKEINDLKQENKKIKSKNKKLISKEKEIKGSTSWKLTSPLRKAGKKFK